MEVVAVIWMLCTFQRHPIPPPWNGMKSKTKRSCLFGRRILIIIIAREAPGSSSAIKFMTRPALGE